MEKTIVCRSDPPLVPPANHATGRRAVAATELSPSREVGIAAAQASRCRAASSADAAKCSSSASSEPGCRNSSATLKGSERQ